MFMKMKKKAAAAKEKVKQRKVDCPFARDPSNEESSTCLLCGQSYDSHNRKSMGQIRKPVTIKSKIDEFEVSELIPSRAPSAGGKRFQVIGKGFINYGPNLAYAKFGSSAMVPLTVVSDKIMTGLSPRRQSYFPTVMVLVTIDGGVHWSQKNLNFIFEGNSPNISSASAVVYWGNYKRKGANDSWTKTCFYGRKDQEKKKLSLEEKAKLQQNRPDIYTLQKLNVWDVAPQGSLPVHQVAVSEHGSIVLSPNGMVFVPPTTYPTTDSNLIDTEPFAPHIGLMSSDSQSSIVEVPSSTRGPKGSNARTDGKNKRLKNFEYVLRRTNWLFCYPFAEHIRLDAKREKKIKPMLTEKPRQMIVERVPHWQMLQSLSYRKVTQVASGKGHFCMLTGAMDEYSLYTFGANARGQLGHGDLVNRKIPTLVEYFRKPRRPSTSKDGASAHRAIYTISCGPDYTVCSAINIPDGTTSVFAWGSRNEPSSLKDLVVQDSSRKKYLEGRPYTSLFHSENQDHLEPRQDVILPVEVMHLNFMVNENTVLDKDFSNLIKHSKNEQKFGARVSDYPCEFNSAALVKWLELEYLELINDMGSMLGEVWINLTDDGAFEISKSWQSKDQQGLTKKLWAGSSRRQNYVEDMMLTSEALGALESHTKMQEGLVNDSCTLKGSDLPFEEAESVLVDEVGTLLLELEKEISALEVRIEKKKSKIEGESQLLVELQEHKKRIGIREKNISAAFVAGSNKSHQIQDEDSAGDEHRGMKKSESKKSLRKQIRHQFVLQMKPISSDSLQRSISKKPELLRTASMHIPLDDSGKGDERTLYSIFDEFSDTLRDNSEPPTIVLDSLHALKQEKGKVSKYISSCKKGQAFVHADIANLRSEIESLEIQRSVLLSCMGELEEDSKTQTDGGAQGNELSTIEEIATLEHLWSTICRYSPESLAVLHSQMTINTGSSGERKNLHVRKDGDDEKHIDRGNEDESETNAYGSLVSKNDKYEDHVLEARHVQKSEHMGLSESVAISNLLMKDVFDKQIRGKDDIIEFQMPTNTAHPYALYLQMVFSNLSLRGKLNFASLAYVQMVQESLTSPAANATASFYDHYDMTKFNFLSHVDDQARAELQMSKHLDAGGSDRTSMTEGDLRTSEMDEGPTVQSLIEDSEKALRRATVTKSEGKESKEMEIVLAHSRMAMQLMDSSRRNKGVEIEVEELIAMDYDYLRALLLEASSMAHLGRLKDASGALEKAFHLIDTEIRHVDKKGGKIARKAFKAHAKELNTTLSVPYPPCLAEKAKKGL